MIIALPLPPPLVHEGAAFIFTVMCHLAIQQAHKKVSSSCVCFAIQLYGKTPTTPVST